MVFARGQWWAALPLVVEITALGIVLAFALMAIAGGFGWFVLFLVGFAIPLPLGFVGASDWALRAGRVRYELEGTRLIAMRGRRQLASIDASKFDEIAIRGRLTWANTLLKGSAYPPFGMLDGLPQLEAIKRINRWEDERATLPPILIWGARSITEIQSYLTAELERASTD